MTKSSKQMRELDNLLESYFEELRAMPDEEVLEGEPPSAVQARAMDRLKQAKATAGRRRLAAARNKMQSATAAGSNFSEDVSLEQARAYITKAANDNRFTLVARKLNEMAPAEVIRLYQQIRKLESEQEPGNDV